MPGRLLSARASRSLVQRPCLAQRRNWRETVSGLPKAGGRAAQGGGAGQGVGGEPEDGVEPRAGVADGAAGGASVGNGGSVGVLGGGELGLALPLGLDLGGTVEKGGEDAPFVVGELLPGALGGVAAVKAEAELHGAPTPHNCQNIT